VTTLRRTPTNNSLVNGAAVGRVVFYRGGSLAFKARSNMQCSEPNPLTWFLQSDLDAAHLISKDHTIMLSACPMNSASSNLDRQFPNAWPSAHQPAATRSATTCRLNPSRMETLGQNRQCPSAAYGSDMGVALWGYQDWGRSGAL
jgi:hypothetical protein